MTVLPFLQKHGLWLFWPLFGLGLLLLWFCIVTVGRLGDRHRICSLPLAAEQTVEFAEAGQMLLWLEGPYRSRRFAGLRYELVGGDGSALKGRPSLSGFHSSVGSRRRVVARVFDIPSPGLYVLRVESLGDPRPTDEEHQLVFTRPYLPKAVGCILGILLGGILAMGSLVGFLVCFFIRRASGGDA